jgi:6-phosphogluconate dehydrogenase
VFLGNIKEAFDKDAHLKNLLLDDFFKNAIEKCQVQFCDENIKQLQTKNVSVPKINIINSFSYDILIILYIHTINIH